MYARHSHRSVSLFQCGLLVSALLFCTARLVQAQPAWNVDPSAFNQTMTMVGTLYLDGASATDPEDIVAALIDGEVRGVAGEDQVQVFEGQWYYFMTIYANTTGENITFQVYDASLDDIRLITETLTFTGEKWVLLTTRSSGRRAPSAVPMATRRRGPRTRTMRIP